MAKALELLGVPATVNHFPFADGLPDGVTHHVFAVRDPRNVVVSWLRFQGDVVTPGKFLARFRWFDDAPLCESMARFEGWLDDPRTIVVRYEDLIADDREMRRIAAALGIPYVDGAFEELPGLTRTWYARKSDYAEVWTPDVIAAWYAERGGDLLSRWGY